MEKGKVKRSLMANFLNTAPEAETPVWSLIGINVAEATTSYNPQTTTDQDVTSDTATTDITGYQPNTPITQSFTRGDPVCEFVNKLRKKRALLEGSYTEMLTVDMFETAVSGAFPAELQPVSVQIDSYGGAGTDPLTLAYTLNYRGDQTSGMFNPSTKTFTPDAPESAPSSASNRAMILQEEI